MSIKVIETAEPAGQPLPLPDNAPVDLARPVERAIAALYWHCDAADEIARVVECGTVDGRPVDLIWLVMVTAALQTTAAMLSSNRLTERAWGKKPLEMTP
ncbi:MAG TPA: hypothetical protein VH643_02985 [Gemmataceae bacterium]|jgi:hypothetical protein